MTIHQLANLKTNDYVIYHNEIYKVIKTKGKYKKYLKIINDDGQMTNWKYIDNSIYGPMKFFRLATKLDLIKIL